MSISSSKPANSFAELGLSEKLVSILGKLQLTQPTPIQLKAIPIAATGGDVMGIAQTGTGKTLAFVLPMLQQIARTGKRGLIILPTRELAQQVNEQVHMVGRQVGVKSALVIGGNSAWQQIRDLKRNPHVIIGTPGRIVDLLKRGSINLDKTGVLVLDEADRMLDMGFAPDIERIIKRIPQKRQTMLFSATMPQGIVKIAMQYMKSPVRIEIARAGTIAEKVEQAVYVVERHDKMRLLDKLLSDHSGVVLVFSRTKHGARKLCRAVSSMGYSVAEIHSNLSLGQRRRSLEGFKSGKFRVLVATDIASRGIDVDNIELVINYDLPDNPEDYVHRVGRTGRADKAGKAISFAMPDQRRELERIERAARYRFKLSDLPDLPPVRYKGGEGGYRSQEKQISGKHRRTTFQYARGNKQRRQRPARGPRPSGGSRRHIQVHS